MHKPWPWSEAQTSLVAGSKQYPAQQTDANRNVHRERGDQRRRAVRRRVYGLAGGLIRLVVLGEEVRFCVVAVGCYCLVWYLADFCAVERWTLLGMYFVFGFICRVEVRLYVGYCHGGVFGWGACGPVWVAVAPVVHEEMTGDAGDALGHRVQDLAVDDKGNGIARPVKTVLVELLVWPEWKRLHLVGLGLRRVVAVPNGLW